MAGPDVAERADQEIRAEAERDRSEVGWIQAIEAPLPESRPVDRRAVAFERAPRDGQVNTESGDHEKERHTERAKIDRQEREEGAVDTAVMFARDVGQDDSQRSNAPERIDRRQPARAFVL